MKKLIALILPLAITLGGAGAVQARVTAPADKIPMLYTNEEKAVAVLESLASGNPQPITDYVSADGYVQHNLTFADGRQTMLDALPHLKAAGSTVEVQRVFSDGDYVFLHTRYNLFGDNPQAGFDIFRFEGGVIVEHWDNLDTLVEHTPSGHTQLDGPATATNPEDTSFNKRLVERFVRDVLMGENPGRLTDYFDGDRYIQHNVSIADGLSGLGAALGEMAEAGIEMVYDEIHMVLGQGSFVLVVSEGSFGGAHTSYYDLFRVENDRIAEHWDVMEPILPAGERANANGKY